MQTLLKNIGTAFLKDTVFLLKKEPEFLSQSVQEREKGVKNHLGSTYPSSLTHYLSHFTATEFKEEFHVVTQALEGTVQEGKENTFLQALSNFFAQEMGMMVDTLPLDFFFRSLSERLKTLNQLLPTSSALGLILKQTFAENTYQETTAAAHQSLEILKNSPVIVVQAPLEMQESMRKEIREHFSKKYPYAFVEFQINPQILGGMRVFVNGQVEDQSWLAKIQGIMKLHYLQSA